MGNCKFCIMMMLWLRTSIWFPQMTMLAQGRLCFLRVSRSSHARLHTQALVLVSHSFRRCVRVFFQVHTIDTVARCMGPNRPMALEAPARTSFTRRPLSVPFSSKKIDLPKIQFDVTDPISNTGSSVVTHSYPPYFIPWHSSQCPGSLP